ncbi:MAG: Na+/H+ antiporter NhaA [Gemmatimonadales bacterium]|nr:Na+/H+ antiporter NhaA [Gemmatimonadales bacterium]NIN12518.1 Na+/H+ antiporter NhaA [Gemmatimonadales bacterium]NIN50889.1 Na+/H+ antiporter NhaA [Gemmatimonadales bacterium]NIP08353.1 Na+/H+ antiporter NhaA [Gemmatimonadales bacterium]NIR03450.1 Na+/H+ antiporter NhaA [Gemmatimonadales bacterium]
MIPPEAWLPARRVALAMRRPVERFLEIEAASGIVLLLAAAVAIAWANSPWAGSYEKLWHTPIRAGVGEWTMERSLHFWINDLLMTVFFLLAGLEIKREMVQGALSNVKRATLPIAAAVGGMVVPAAIYVALNATGAGARGWGVPMATDIAFAVGVLVLLGKRVPAALRVLLLAFAIIDDVGAILVIALFYSAGFALAGLAAAALGVVLLFAFGRIGVRPGVIFVLPLVLLWGGLLHAGIHPTIAGVILGLAVPTRAWFGREGFLKVTHRALRDFQQRAADNEPDEELLEPLNRIGVAQREAVSPALRGETLLHPWVAYGVMPLFALANAGVNLSGIRLGDPGAVAVLGGVTIGLLVGKPAGVLLASWITVRLRLAALPVGVDWRGMLVVGSAAGIGFTMAIFIAELAFEDQGILTVAKLGILVATTVAGCFALLAGRMLLPRQQPAEVASITDSSAESSTAVWSGTYPAPEAAEPGTGQS